MPSRKEKCPTCGSTVKKQEYKSQIQTKRMRYSKECLSLIDVAIKEINASRSIQLTDTDVHAFLSEIDGCDTDMIIMSLNNYLKSNAPREGKGLRYLSAIVTNNNSSKAVRKRNEYLTMDRIPPRVD